MRSGTLALCIVASLTAACKTTGEGGGLLEEQDGVILDGQDLQSDGDIPSPQEELAKIPVSLWSPAQRQSTAGYLFLVGEYLSLKERDPRQSLPLLEAAYGLDPNPFLGGKMLAAKAASGDRSEALLEARKMVLLYPRDAHLRFFYGEMLVRGGDLNAAAEQLEKCLELDQSLEGPYLLLAQVYQTQKQPAKALVVTKELVKNIPSSIMGWAMLSRIYLAMSQPKEALVPARRAWEMQSSNPHLTQIYAIVLQLNGKTKQAISIYEQLYRMDPTDDELTARMVDLYREIGNLESALELLDEMAKQGGQRRPVVYMQKAILLWELKRNDEAVRLLDGLVKDYPKSDKVRYLAAFGNERVARLERALTLYQSIPQDSSLWPEAEIRMMLILKTQKRHDEALALADRIRKRPQLNWDVYGVLGGVYGDAGRYEDAIRLLGEGYAKHTDKPRLLFLKGVYQEKAGDIKACMQTMREVIKSDPSNSSAYNFLGYLYAERGENLDEAEKLIKRALELKPNDGFYLDSLGWVYYQKGDYKRALEMLQKAQGIEPEEGVILEHIADVKLKQGDRQGARKLYEEALRKQVEERDRARIEGKLRQLVGANP